MNPPPGTVLLILSVTFHCKAVICSLINIFDWAEVKKKKVEDGDVALIHEV